MLQHLFARWQDGNRRRTHGLYLFRLFLSPLPSGEEALERVSNLTALLLPGGGAGRARVPFHVSVTRAEQALIPKLALLEAQASGFSAEARLAAFQISFAAMLWLQETHL